MRTEPLVEQAHCRELAMPAGSLFEFTSRFVSADRLEALMAVYALIQAIASIPFAATEDAVKWAKLKWWSDELAADPHAPSRHPVLRAMCISGAREHIDNSLARRLVNVAAVEIDDSPDSDLDTMFDRFAAFAEPGILMELALDRARIGPDHLRQLAAASGMHTFISGFFGNYQPLVQRLPLDVLARFNASVERLWQKPAPAELARITGHLAAAGERCFVTGLNGLRVTSEAGSGVAGAHLQLRWAIEHKRLGMIARDAGGFLGSGNRYGPSYAWFAWKVLRRLNRRATAGLTD